jgi:rhomboid protease GluP
LYLKTYFKKLRHIVPTFTVIAFGSVIVLAFIRWILFLQFSIIDINEEVWGVFIPLIFPILPTTLWLRWRFRILTFKRDASRGETAFQILASLTITFMLGVSQSYITTATGELTELPTIKDIEKVEKTRYYTLASFDVAPAYGGSYTTIRETGKNNQYLNFDIYFVIPITVNSSEEINETPKYWYGIKFDKEISNNISSEEKERQYQAFYKECVNKMNRYEFYSLDHFEKTPTSGRRQNFLKAIETRIQKTADNSFIVLEPVTTKYEDRNGNKFAWIFGAFGIGLAIFSCFLTLPGYDEDY